MFDHLTDTEIQGYIGIMVMAGVAFLIPVLIAFGRRNRHCAPIFFLSAAVWFGFARLFLMGTQKHFIWTTDMIELGVFVASPIAWLCLMMWACWPQLREEECHMTYDAQLPLFDHVEPKGPRPPLPGSPFAPAPGSGVNA